MTDLPELLALRKAIDAYDANDSETSYYDAKEVCNAARRLFVALDAVSKTEILNENALPPARGTTEDR